jgi:hypothetical protein
MIDSQLELFPNHMREILQITQSYMSDYLQAIDRTNPDIESRYWSRIEKVKEKMRNPKKYR